MIIYLYWPGGQTALHFAVVAGNLDMVVLLVEKFGADLLAEDLELFLRGGALHVERGHQDPRLVALGDALGDFRGGGGLACALQADQHDRDRRGRIQVDRLAFAP